MSATAMPAVGGTSTAARGQAGGRADALGYQPALDGMRALAIGGVLVGHANGAWLPGGHFGVSVFFVLSGFLITSLLQEEWDRSGGLDIRAFYRRRVARLVPALVVVLAVSAVVAALVGRAASLIAGLVPAITYVENIVMITSPGEQQPFAFAWSLSIEEQFYLLWPLAALLLMRQSRRRMLWIALALAVASIAWRGLMPLSQTHLYYGTDTRAAALLIGCFAALWRPRIPLPAVWSLAGLGVVGAAYASDQVVGSSVTPSMMTAVEVATAVVIVAAVSSPQCLTARVLALRPLVHVGQLAYGLYLWNILLRGLVARQWEFNGGLASPAAMVVWIVATFAIAEASLHLVERPARQRLAPHHGPPSAQTS